MRGRVRIMNRVKPIETVYDGYRFRSRLEARWAVFFNAVNAEWEYEPEGFDLGKLGWYLPDFFIKIRPEESILKKFPNAGYWCEIKGRTPTGEELQKLSAVAKYTKHHGYLLQGSPGKHAAWLLSNTGAIDSLERRELCDYVIASLIMPGEFDWDRVFAAMHQSRAARF